MSGIAGVLGAGPLEKFCAAALAMLRAEAHRGPDDEGLVALMTAEPVCQAVLGYRRLSISDPSSEANQPMQNEKGTAWVVLDGEIYNARALGKELASNGHRIRAGTDAEVLLHLYQEYGDGCFSRLKGMFAIAIWDHKARRLILARDRLGEKPLYYVWDGTRFLFASEVKALLASGLVVRRLNPTAVAAYLSLGSVPSPLTVIDGVRCLEPGSLLSFQDGRLRIRPYWDLVFQEKSGFGEAQVGEPLREHIRESVRLRLAGDVPVGAFLSDEVDSSALLSFMRESLSGELRTFSLAFEQPRFNKRPFARALAERFQTQHTEYVITSQEVLRELNLIVAAMDQPSVNGISSYFVSRVARSSGVAVALSGLGGDELFGGCPSFWLGLKLLQCDGSSGAYWESRKAVEALFDSLPLNGQKKKIAAFLRRRPSLEGIYLVAKRLFWENSLERILSRHFINGSANFDPVLYLQDIGHGHTESPSNRISRLELRTDLHNQLLRDSDAMSMAHSLEVRAPFLDHGLVEFLAEVPAAVRFASEPKHLLFQAMADGPASERRDSSSTFPLDDWLQHEWRDLGEQLLCRPTVMSVDLFDRQGLKQLWSNYLQGQARWSKIWAVVILQLWIRRHIDGEISLLPPGYQFVRSG